MFKEPEILKDVPLPRPRKKSGEVLEFAKKLQSGDCVAFEFRNDASSLQIALKKLNIEAVSRVMEDGKIGVWVI